MLGIDSRAEKITVIVGTSLVLGFLTFLFRPAAHPPRDVPKTETAPPPSIAKPLSPDEVAARNKKAKETANRLAACSILEGSLLDGGHVVRVLLMSDNDTKMVVVGPSVSRPFARQFLSAPLRKQLRGLGFWKVVFMRSQFNYAGEYDLVYNTTEWFD